MLETKCLDSFTTTFKDYREWHCLLGNNRDLLISYQVVNYGSALY